MADVKKVYLNKPTRMRTLKIALYFVACCACSSCNPRYGFVKADPYFSCDGPQSQTEISFGLNKICESKNSLEIRVEVSFELLNKTVLYVLTNSDSGWAVVNYDKAIAKSTHTFKLTSQEWVKSLFDTLKKNNILTLPDQRDIKLPYYFDVDDGVICSVTYKVDSEFRHYEFNNPGIYREKFENIKEFENYFSIADAFYGAFAKQ